MSVLTIRVAALAGWLFAAGQLAAQEPGLRLSTTAQRSSAAGLPTSLSARRIDGVADKETIAEGDVLLRRGNRSIAADWLRFSSESEEVEAKGNVRLEQEGAVITGPGLRLRTAESIGSIESPAYTITSKSRADGQTISARGEASRMDIEGEGLYRLIDATFTTCVPGDDSWYMQVGESGLRTRSGHRARGDGSFSRHPDPDNTVPGFFPEQAAQVRIFVTHSGNQRQERA